MMIAWYLASLIMQADCCLYSQWFTGEENIVVDSLSHDFHLSNDCLTHLIKSSIHSQISFCLELFV
jgi:hypothetical protein